MGNLNRWLDWPHMYALWTQRIREHVMTANVYVKPVAGSNKVAYFVGHAPNDPPR